MPIHLENSIITGIKKHEAKGFGIIELSKNNYKPEAHAMNKSITQATQNDKQISESIKSFSQSFIFPQP